MTILLALLTSVGPVVAAVLLAREQGMNLEVERAMSLAQEVLYRSDRGVSQMQDALTLLASEADAEPCSEQMLTQLRQTGLRFEHLIGVGYAVDAQMHCSTFGLHPEGVDLGPADVVLPAGGIVRLNVRFPLVATSIAAFQRGNFVALVHVAQAVDLSVEDGTALASFSPGLPGVRASRGPVNPQWSQRLGDETSVTFIDGDYLVAIVRSERISVTGAIAAIPLQSMERRVLEFILLLVPLGLLAGAALTLLVLFLARQQMSLSSRIRMGLRRNEFYLAYQPVVDLASGRWLGAEALLRWRSHSGEIIMPDLFIPAAEKSGLITQLTERVIALAGADMAQLMQIDPGFFLSINLSAVDLDSRRIMQLLQDMRQHSGAGQYQIMVELTERTLLAPEMARRNVQAIREQGIAVAIDDFGTGYSSLSYLEKMQLDCLKIDKLFVEVIGTEAATNRVVLHIIDMARALGLKIVAEGVETQAQADFLKDKGVRLAQGWLFARPAEFQAFIAGLRANHRQRPADQPVISAIIPDARPPSQPNTQHGWRDRRRLLPVRREC